MTLLIRILDWALVAAVFAGIAAVVMFGVIDGKGW
jgi:hypothetical protein